jgi:SAM-dependent methyltransferase
MPILTDIRNALAFLRRGEWGELLFRLRVYFGKVDLTYASVRELGLQPGRSHDYRHSGGIHLERILDSLKINSRDAIVDFGSGKGGALITFAKYPFSRITGVELLPELVTIARRNLKILKIANVQMVISDAALLTDLDDYTHFYFYSPFPRSVMAAVMVNLKESLFRRPRRAFIIYCNPEFHDTVITDSPFVKLREFRHQSLGLPVYLYSNQP